MGHQYTLTAVSTHATDWRQHAACRDTDPDLFFPPPLGGNLTPLLRQIRKLCDPCPVRRQCLQFILDAEGDAKREDRHGVFAGTTPRQRWVMWRCNTGRCEHPQHKRDGQPTPEPTRERPPTSGWARADRPCTVDGCDRRVHCRGMCRQHYLQWAYANKRYRHGTAFGYRVGCRCTHCRQANRHRKTRSEEVRP